MTEPGPDTPDAAPSAYQGDDPLFHDWSARASAAGWDVYIRSAQMFVAPGGAPGAASRLGVRFRATLLHRGLVVGLVTAESRTNPESLPEIEVYTPSVFQGFVELAREWTREALDIHGKAPTDGQRVAMSLKSLVFERLMEANIVLGEHYRDDPPEPAAVKRESDKLRGSEGEAPPEPDAPTAQPEVG